MRRISGFILIREIPLLSQKHSVAPQRTESLASSPNKTSDVLVSQPFPPTMRFSSFATAAMALTSIASAKLTWRLEKADNPTKDQADAYEKISAAMTGAVNRYTRITDACKDLNVSYSPGVPTAEASLEGNIWFGSDRVYMTERVALHEIAHTLGVGTTDGFHELCESGNWTTALPMLQCWDGEDAKINCNDWHFWPYGLNYEEEWSEEAADKHCKLVQAMRNDGMV